MIYLAVNLAFIATILLTVGFFKWSDFCQDQAIYSKNEALWTTLQFGLPAFIILNAVLFVKVNG